MNSISEKLFLPFFTKITHLLLKCKFLIVIICGFMLWGCSDSFEKTVMSSDTDRKAFLRIDAGICIGCGKCYESCPNRAIELFNLDSNYVYIIDPQKCIRCGICANNCKVGAIDWKR